MYNKIEDENVKTFEENLSKFWLDADILNKSIKPENPPFIFYDGPATANGMPGIHHLMAKVLKDTICKYKAMKGYQVKRKIGWDTHGLPVEVNVEKILGFSGKQDIEKYGIDKFNEKCKEDVMKNEKSFKLFTNRMGQLIDTTNPYVTYHNDYIETEWYILKEFFQKGLFYEGTKIIPYCPRCGTGLASHEVAQGYKMVSVNSIYVAFKVKDKDEYFLAWTTTPWTLLANEALAVNPKETYVKIESKGTKFILAEVLASKIFSDYKVIEKFKGKELENIKYEPLFDDLHLDKDKAYYVTLGDFVTMEDGTGIVHIAPSFGEDDFKIGEKYHLPKINPVDKEGKYSKGPWEGRFVLEPELELEIIKTIKEKGNLFKKQKLEHNYPHCWRCDTPLIYYSSPSYYLKTTAFKDEIVKANEKVNWYPEFVGKKRFHNWLSNLVDWSISRNRYWGTPIPLWKCSCGHEEMIGSVEELRNRSINDLTGELDLHRPYVDNIHFKCPKCGKEMTRTKEVLDCWFDSGAMPFAQIHYPFEHQDDFNEYFPADFISEGIDQTRGWFNSLIIISTFLKGVAPYKNVLVNDLVLAKDGSKMHKSRGNAIHPFEALDTYGADAIRWFFVSASPVWTPLRYDEEGIKEVSTKMFLTLKNVYNFFALYREIDDIDPSKLNINNLELELIDKWMLSKYNSLVKNVTENMDNYDITKSAKLIETFVNDDLSNWYIRRNRKRFWSAAKTNKNSKEAVYKVTYEVLLGLTKLIAPISPFLVEVIYKNLTGKLSVQLETYPLVDEKLIDKNLEKKMDKVILLVGLGRKIRDISGIKNRQVLSKALVDIKLKPLIGDLSDLIKEEINVKELIFIKEKDNYLKVKVKANFKELGPKYGKDVNNINKILENLSSDEGYKLMNGESINIQFNGHNEVIEESDVILSVEAKEGYHAEISYEDYIIIDTELSDTLISEGLAREVVSRIQNLRKEMDLVVTDKIDIKYFTKDDTLTKAIKDNKEFISKNTLASSLEEERNDGKELEIDSKIINIKINKTC